VVNRGELDGALDGARGVGDGAHGAVDGARGVGDGARGAGDGDEFVKCFNQFNDIEIYSISWLPYHTWQCYSILSFTTSRASSLVKYTILQISFWVSCINRFPGSPQPSICFPKIAPIAAVSS